MGHNGNGENGNGDGVVLRPTTLLLNVIERLTVVEQQNLNIIGEQDEAKASRRLIHSKLDDVGQKMAGLSEKVEATAGQVGKLAPQVAEHEKLRQNFNGGLLVMGGIASIIMVAVGFVLKDLWAWLAAHLRWN